jgi:2-polyprenyl-6-methoxyphenol hydroxylase-like FAD-dependent oxidoreductase
VARHSTGSVRVGVVGGGPAGSLFAQYALRFAEQAGSQLQVTIYEGKDFHRRGPMGCNMCAGLIPNQVLSQLTELELQFPPDMFLGTIAEYALATAARQARVRVLSRWRMASGAPDSGGL